MISWLSEATDTQVTAPLTRLPSFDSGMRNTLQ